MSNVRLRKRYSRTINLGNYESARIEIELEKDLENPTPKLIQEASNKLLELEKIIVEQESKGLKLNENS